MFEATCAAIGAFENTTGDGPRYTTLALVAVVGVSFNVVLTNNDTSACDLCFCYASKCIKDEEKNSVFP